MLRRRPRTSVSEVVFVTRVGCSLCDDARPVVERLTKAHGVPLVIADVDTDPAMREWSDHVPVVLLDGVVHSRWWVEERDLKAALRA